MARAMSGAEIVIQALADQGVEVMFGYPGGAVLPIYDELFKQNGIKHYLVRHEQGATHAAEGYARSSGKVGVVLVTSGPGATNAVTGLTDALMDSIPIVCISGQVPTSLIGSDAFQECDTVGITRPCTKHNYLVKDVNDLARILHEAFYVAQNGRPGPVLVDIPKDVQFAKGTYAGPSKVVHRTYRPQLKGSSQAIRDAVDLMASAKRPVFYTGGGVINSGPNASRLLRELADLTGFPVTSTLMGLGSFPASSSQWLGMLGMHGTYEANLAMHDCDVMICVGARFDDRITGRLSGFSPGSKKIHIDIDPSSISKNVRADIPIVGDCGYVLEEMVRVWRARAPQVDKKALKAWWAEIAGWRDRDCLKYKQGSDVIMPQYAIQRLYELTKNRDTYITTEVGQHQMWAAQFYKFEEPNRLMTSGGLGTMGYGIPAAIGAQVAHPESLVIDIAGEFLGDDDHAGAVHRGAIRLAHQDFHLEQRIYGHGAPVAGTAAWRPLFALLRGGAAGLCQACRGVPRRGPARGKAGRTRRSHRSDDRDAKARGVRLPRGEARQLLPHDPVGRGAQQDAPWHRQSGEGDRFRGLRRWQGFGLGGANE